MVGIFRSPLLLSSLAGVLAAIGLMFGSFWPLVLIGFSLFLYTLWHYTKSLWASVWCGLIFGLVTSGGSLMWFWDALPLSWLSIPSGIVPYLLIGTSWALTTIAVALPFMALAPLLYLLRGNPWAVPGTAIALVATEELRMWSFAFFFHSQGAHFSIPALGYSLAENPYLLQVATMGGIAALTAAIGLAAASIALLIQRAPQTDTKRGVLPIMIGGLCVLLVALLPLFRTYEATDTTTARIALIATNVAPRTFPEPHTLLSYMRRAVIEGASVVALPEGFGLARVFPNETLRQSLLHSLSPTQDTLFVSSAHVRHEDGTYGELLYESSSRGIIGRHEKSFLVPIGEYIPAYLHAFFSLVGSEALHDYTTYVGTGIQAGTTLTSIPFENLHIAAFMCSEMLSPRLYSLAVDQQATNMLVTVSNNSWFHGSRTLYEKLTQIAKVHAVQHRTYFLVASNNSPSFAIDPTGRVVAETLWGEEGVLLVDVSL